MPASAAAAAAARPDLDDRAVEQDRRGELLAAAEGAELLDRDRIGAEDGVGFENRDAEGVVAAADQLEDRLLDQREGVRQGRLVHQAVDHRGDAGLLVGVAVGDLEVDAQVAAPAPRAERLGEHARAAGLAQHLGRILAEGDEIGDQDPPVVVELGDRVSEHLTPGLELVDELRCVGGELGDVGPQAVAGLVLEAGEPLVGGDNAHDLAAAAHTFG